MQPTTQENEHVPATPQNLLDRCLVDGNAAEISSGRRRRGEALGISFTIETVALALLIVVPILTSVAQPKLSPPPLDVLVFSGRHSNPAEGPRHVLAPSPGIRSTNFLPFTGGHSSQPPSTKTDDSGSAAEGVDEWIIGPGGDPLPNNGISILNPAPPAPIEIKKAEERRPLKISGTIIQAQQISQIEPRYPPLAQQIRLQGSVVLHAIISRDGRITSLDVLSGHPLFVKAALDAVQQWRYRPTLLGGEPVEVETTITVNFRFQQ